ncbi:hypothetical protein CDL12_18284 [Handroanthus impetiginosus]|uniref:Rapid ALkalinization Factor n=1 Tax=Handroanthus impetiginosus TaxID=429701 RepID=A0A2G9GV62_9LAMI|nr:hypothetical protein CDL12_18284 [Handroanthus impetiginosus]
MAKVLVVTFAILLMASAVLSLSTEDERKKKIIGYPVLIPGRRNGPAVPANPYRRGCEKSERCRGGPLEKFLDVNPPSLQKASSHSLQRDVDKIEIN